MPNNMPDKERTEREYALEVNQAVANTEEEIFGDALGDDPLENDGDTSLEEMGEGLEGDDLEEEDKAGEQAEEEGGKEAKAPEGQELEQIETEDEEGDAEDQEAEPERPQRGVPPGRLREESERRRAAETEVATLRQQMAEMNGRMTEISTRVNAPPQPAKVEQKTEKPDMFADPEGYERWIRTEAVKDAKVEIDQRFTAFQQQQQERATERVNNALAEAAKGERSFEFGPAYNQLIGLDPKAPANRALVQRIFESSDPAKELFEWWDNNGGQEYRDQILERLAPRQSRQRSQQPRHETRIPESLRSSSQPPSLNSARGGQRQEVRDPEMLDDSDESTFRFATRR
jgi:hypothetical protein